jgi:DNA polymerase III alpha subunit (gram-positive type)
VTKHLVFLDCETTGLDPSQHHIWEIAYAVDDGPIKSSFVPHSVVGADPVALRIGRYQERFHFEGDPAAFVKELRAALSGNTLVGSNPAFDAAFLRARWGEAPWHYALLDLKSYAMGALGLDRPPKMEQIATQLGAIAPDHTAAGDVQTLRQCFNELRNIYAEAAW